MGLRVLFVLLVLSFSGLLSYNTRAGAPMRAHAATSSTLNFQARLMSSSGGLVPDGNYSLQFRLYDAASGGANEWTETQSAVTVKNGYLSVHLGSVTPFGSSIDWSQEKWLTMNVNSDGEMTPRIKLTANPYSFRAGQSDSLTNGSGTLTADNLAQLAPSSVQAINTALAALRINQTGAGFLAQLQGNGSDVFTIAKTGDVTSAGNGTLQGGTLQLGTATQSGGLVLNDGSSNTGTIQTAPLGSNRVYTLPDADGTICLTTTCAGGGNGFVQDGNSFGALATLGTNDNFALAFETFGTTRATILANGNFGIGETNPSALFSVGSGSPFQVNNSGGITGVGLNNTNGGISNAGSITGVGANITATGALTIASTGANNLTLNSGSGLAILGATTLRTADDLSLDLAKAANTTLTLSNSGAGVANLNLSDGVLQTNSTTRLTNAGALQNVTGTNADGVSFDANTITSGTLNDLRLSANVTLQGNTFNGISQLVKLDSSGKFVAIDASALTNLTAANLTGQVAVANGGTGAATFTANGVLFGSGTGALGVTAAGTNGQCLVATTGAAPAWGSCAGAGSGVTLQSAYTGGGSVLTTDAKDLSFTLADTTTDSNFLINIATGSSGKFAVQNNGTDILRVTSAGTVISMGGLTVSADGANITGGLNNNSGNITNAGNISGVGTLTLTGAISGGTTYGGSGNINTTGGSLQTNSTNRIDNSGNLVNIGNLTASGALTISSAGGGDITIDSASNKLVIAATDTTLQRTAAGSYTIDLSDGAATTLVLNNSGAGAASLNLQDGGLQTAGTNRLTNGGALENITGLTVISGGANITGNTLVTGTFGTSSTLTVTSGGLIVSAGGADISGGLVLTTGNLNVAAGDIRTNNITRLENDGNLVNIGNLTATGALIISNAGAGNDITLNSTDQIIFNAGSTIELQDNTNVTGNVDVSGTIASGTNNAFNVDANGNLKTIFTLLDGSSQTNGTSGPLGASSTSMVLDSAANFDVGNYIRLANTNCGGTGVNVCFAKITAKSSNTLTITPALVWADNAAVTEYQVPEIGGTNGSQPLENRYGRGYFIAGVAVGNGTTYYNENSIETSLSTFNLLNTDVTTLNIGGAATTINIGNASGITTIAGNVSFSGNVSAPATGTSGYLSRSGSILQPSNSGDSFTTSGNISTTTTGTITAAAGLTVQSGGANITGNSTVTGTLGVSSALTVSAGGASITGGLTLVTGALNLSSGGITNAGSIAGATTLNLSGAITGATATNTINGLIINSGALSGISTISASGAINAATSTNTINGLVINSGTLSGVTGITFTSGSLNLASGGITNTGSIAGATTLNLSGAITGATATNTINNLIINNGALSGVTGITFISGTLNLANGGITNTGSIAGATTINASGLATLSGGANISGAVINLNNNSDFNTNINTGTSTGTVTIGGGSAPLVINSTNFKVSSAGALSGITTISASGAITAAISTNTINGLVINSGALSGVTGITFTSGSLNLNNGGITNTGSIAGATTITASGNINTTAGDIQTNTITRLTSTGALQNVTGNNTNGVSFDANTITSGLLPVSRGGTGAGTFTTNGIIYGNNTGALQVTAAGTGGQVLLANASGLPIFTSLSGDITINSSGVTTIGANAVALGTDTTGNYLADITIESGGGLVVSGTGSETATASLTIRRDCSNNQIVKWSTAGSGAWNCAADNTGLSDVRVKNNVVTINENIFDKLKSVRVVEFDFDCTSPAFNNLHCNTDHQAGVIAQELEMIFPELVFEDSNGYKNVRYGILGFYNMRALGQLASIISANGDAKLNNLQTGAILRLTSTGQLQNINGLNIISGGASIIGGINNNNGGLTNVGSINGATTINASGRITGTNGLSITGETVNLNASSNNATNINTGSSTGTVTIGGGSATLVINSSAFKVSSAGALSGITTINTSGNINTAGVFQANGLSGLSGTCTGNNSYLQNWTITGGIITNGECRTGGILSDARLKENVVQLDSTLDKMKGLNVVTYDFKCQNSDYADLSLDCDRQTGVIAQELAEIFPELVYQGQDGYYRVRSDALGFYNLKAVTEIASKLDSKGNATLNTVTTDGVLRLTSSGALQNINGLTLSSGGASIMGGLNNNAGGLTNTGAVMGATTIDAKMIMLNAGDSGDLLTLKKDNKGVFTVFNNGALELKLSADNAFVVKDGNNKDYFSVNTKGGLVRIGTGRADDAAVLLVLDNVHLDGDPQGVNGAQYYNTAMERFRCHQHNRWQNCLPAGNAEYIIAPARFSWNLPEAEQEIPGSPRTWVDLTSTTSFRLNIQMNSPGASGAECQVQFAVAETGPWFSLDGDNTFLAVDRTGALKTEWTKIKAQAFQEVLLRAVCRGGSSNGVPIVSEFNNIRLQVR